MDSHSRRPDDAPQDPNAPHSAEARRRQLLRRSLGLAAPVALTLASTPVSAGRCLSASAFVSVNTNMSRQPRSAEACWGQSPDSWRQEWESSALKEQDRFWRGLTVQGTHPFHSNNTLGAKPLTYGFGGNSTLYDVLRRPDTIEAHVVAAWLNAQRSTNRMLPPFDNPQAVRAIWTNIAARGGLYSPGNGLPDIRPEGVLQWLARTWQTQGLDP